MNLNFTLILQIISFLILMGLLTKFLYKPLIKLLDERKDSVAGNLEAANKAKEEAEAAADATKQALDNAKHEALKIKEDMRKASDTERLAIIREAKQQAAAVVEQAKQGAEKEFEGMQARLRQMIAEVSVEAAKKILQREIDQKSHQKLINDCIKEIENEIA